MAARPYGCTVAKVKIAPFDLPTAVGLIKTLKKIFRLRIDINAKWNRDKLLAFLSHFSPEDFDFIEDPGCDIAPFPMASDEYSHSHITIWKPMVKGLPTPKTPVILSSSYESGIGLHQIAALAQNFSPHALGIGTFLYLEDDLLEEPLTLKQGMVHFPQKLQVKKLWSLESGRSR